MESLPCLVLVIILVVAIVAILVRAANKQDADKKAMEQAYQAYQSALARLKKYPTDPDAKRHALDVGRGYANMTREQKGVTIFDEMALMNDISAATAGASSVAARPATSVEMRLQELEALRTKGLITDTEYAAKRQRLIDEM
jgi:hypothetical protein